MKPQNMRYSSKNSVAGTMLHRRHRSTSYWFNSNPILNRAKSSIMSPDIMTPVEKRFNLEENLELGPQGTFLAKRSNNSLKITNPSEVDPNEDVDSITTKIVVKPPIRISAVINNVNKIVDINDGVVG